MDSRSAKIVGFVRTLPTVGLLLVEKVFPIVEWLPRYRIREDFFLDLVSGFDNFTVNASEAISYATTFLHLPAARGILACLVPSIVYSILGREAHIGIGPLALSTTLTYSALREVDKKEVLRGGSLAGLEDIALLTLIVGVMTVLVALLGRQDVGFSISKSLIQAMTLSTAIVIEINMAIPMLGISDVVRGKFSHQSGENKINDLPLYKTTMILISRLKDSNIPTLILSLISVSYLLVSEALKKSERINAHLPDIFILILVTIVLSWMFNLTKYGIDNMIVEGSMSLRDIFTITFDPSAVTVRKFTKLVPSAGLIVILGFVETHAIAMRYQYAPRNTVLDINRMVALGMCNIGGSLFGSWPVFAGLGRYVIKTRARARTPLSEAISSVFALATLLWLTPFIGLLPKASCASIIFVAALKLFNLREMKFALKSNFFYEIFTTCTILGVCLIMSLEAACFTTVFFSLMDKLKHRKHARSVIKVLPIPEQDGTAVTITMGESSISYENYFEVFAEIERAATFLVEHIPSKSDSDSATSVDNISRRILVLDFIYVIHMDCDAALAFWDIQQIANVNKVTLSIVNASKVLMNLFERTSIHEKFIIVPLSLSMSLEDDLHMYFSQNGKHELIKQQLRTISNIARSVNGQ